MIITCLLLVLSQDAAAKDDLLRVEPKWSSLQVLEDQGLVVRCKVRQRVSPADSGWLLFEFENWTDKPIHIKKCRYEIKFERLNVRENRRTASGGLASNRYDASRLDFLDPARGEGGMLPPKSIRRLVDQPSDGATATLLRTKGFTEKLWLKGGMDRLKLKVDLEVHLGDGRQLDSPLLDPVECEWWCPNEKDIEQMRKRLRHLLQNPLHNDNDDSQRLLIAAMIDWPEVGSSLTKEELFQAILRRPSGACRNSLLFSYQKRFPNDPEWTKYQETLDRMRELYFSPRRGQAPPAWEKSHVEPLVMLYEADPRVGNWLGILSKHRDDWIQNKQLVSRLSAATIRYLPRLQKPLLLLETREKEGWCWAVTQLASCGDPDMIAKIHVGLADRERIQELKYFSNVHFPNPPPPLRVCDYALHAILTILDGGLENAYRQAGYTHSLRQGDEQAQLDGLRDGMIEVLKKRLKETKP